MVNHEMVTHGSHPDHTPILEEILELGKKNHHHLTHKRDYNDLVRPFRIRNYAIPASGILDDVNVFAPEKGFIWDIARITVDTFTSGSVNAYHGSIADDQILTFTQQGSFFFNLHTLLVRDRVERLVFQAMGITGTAYISLFGYSVAESFFGEWLIS